MKKIYTNLYKAKGYGDLYVKVIKKFLWFSREVWEEIEYDRDHKRVEIVRMIETGILNPDGSFKINIKSM